MSGVSEGTEESCELGQYADTSHLVLRRNTEAQAPLPVSYTTSTWVCKSPETGTVSVMWPFPLLNSVTLGNLPQNRGLLILCLCVCLSVSVSAWEKQTETGTQINRQIDRDRDTDRETETEREKGKKGKGKWPIGLNSRTTLEVRVRYKCWTWVELERPSKQEHRGDQTCASAYLLERPL